jgi:hypothetical protein
MRALISTQNKLAILWSPKAGSASACEIFFKYCDNFDYKKHYWIHNARIEYQKSHPEIYKHNFMSMIHDPNYRVIQVVRNPFLRAVSSYFYYLSYCNNPINFNIFLKNIQEKKINCPNAVYHSRKQFMTEHISDVIKIENMELDINKINHKYNITLEPCKYDIHKWENNMSKIPKEYHMSYENIADHYSIDLINKIYKKDIEFFNYSCPWKI